MTLYMPVLQSICQWKCVMIYVPGKCVLLTAMVFGSKFPIGKKHKLYSIHYVKIPSKKEKQITYLQISLNCPWINTLPGGEFVLNSHMFCFKLLPCMIYVLLPNVWHCVDIN
jgi:hypothetical protein